MHAVPALRIRSLNSLEARPDADYVLYWMTAFRRAEWNFALQHAVDWARRLDKPVVVLEPLRCDYPWASDRLHRFVVQGMVDNREAFADRPVTYHPYVEPESGAAAGLVESLAARAAVVVADDYPCFFLPALLRAAARRITARLEAVDSNGLLPLRATDRVFGRAFDFRRFLQKELTPHLDEVPRADPLAGVKLPRLKQLPADVVRRWPATPVERMRENREWLATLPIDHAVGPVETTGGATAARTTLGEFLRRRLPHYATSRNQPEEDVASGLSPYLHFGHVSVHQVFHDTMRHDEWTKAKLAPRATGQSTGW